MQLVSFPKIFFLSCIFLILLLVCLLILLPTFGLEISYCLCTPFLAAQIFCTMYVIMVCDLIKKFHMYVLRRARIMYV